MQYHLNGYRPGDPDLRPAQAQDDNKSLDVLIVGSGPAGLTLAAYLAGFPQIKTALVEQRDGPLDKGQADGVSCRSMEMFNCFGFAEQVIREAYRVNEATFWKPDPTDTSKIIRSGRVLDVEEGVSEMPHVILNQARVHDMYLDVMQKSPTRLAPHYGRKLIALDYDADGRVTATLEHTTPNGTVSEETLSTRYVVGCDGARSAVRTAIGRKLAGDSANQAWGVMDILATTDFPDIRFKSLIQSATEGTVLLIPREGGYMVRLYVELAKLNPDERVSSRALTRQDLIAAAKRILHPYTLDVKDVVWWSVYEIGQRLTDSFDDVPIGTPGTPRIFIAGDACHTHSPKAGQGMNVSMGDAFNLGWKLVSVLHGWMPEDMLRSYSTERHGIAKGLIDFDQEFAKIMSTASQEQENAGEHLPKFQSYFIEHGRYTAGVSVRYDPSRLTGDGAHQGLAPGFQIGTRFHSAPVIRIADGKPMHLGHVQKVDARWALLAFAGGKDQSAQLGQLAALGDWLTQNPASPIVQFTPKGADPDMLFDLRGILQSHHHGVEITDMPPAFRPVKGDFGLVDYEKGFCADHLSGADIFDMRRIDRGVGCLVILRPDQYVANILRPQDIGAMARFFDGIFQAR